ncbi:leucine--tRNA ligase [Candidatus Woesearchaeota archaeon]|nr:leucine--tRNA ligase [Candidatus Woesearchaeota archaeon]
MAELNFKEIELKWQERWEEAKIFEADSKPDKKKYKKYYSHFTYPYVNAYPHIGHFYTLMRPEVVARFKRMQGYNVLMPQGWHATGSPIINAAQRVKEREQKQLKILAEMGITDEKELKKFEDAAYWIEYFMPEFKKDFKRIGISIDWRREYFTTSLNPHYDKFVRWQFNKLKEKNYVRVGKFPVVYCPKENAPVSDHARSEGEGEVPQEFTLLKFKYKDGYLVAATLRPETVFGQTNMWVNPNIDYVKANVSGEIWYVSKECTDKLILQEKSVKILGTAHGKEFLGKDCVAPGIEKSIIILPATFCDPNIGTGMVTSVPSHAPFDWIALHDLQNDEAACKKYNLDFNKIKSIQPISLIKLEGWEEHPAVQICKEWNIKSQHEKEKLENAKKEIYKAEHFKGIMKQNTGKYSGMKVDVAKDQIKKDLINKGIADIFYELTGKVVCRCLTPCTVKIVADQWFIAYGDKNWKKEAYECLAQMKLYPEKSRTQLEYTIGWLHQWACTREEGLGTRLPWDEKWLIESLSDSTIYLAFDTIAHLIQKVNPKLINDKVFDYIFLGIGSEEARKVKNIEKIRQEFDYWYPYDFNSSGKDLIQNHLTFALFNHTACFPRDKWPSGYGINGWVMVDGKKMSKSLGNFILLRDLPDRYGVDASRITVLSGGEEMDDPNFDSEFAISIKGKLQALYEFSIANYTQNSDNQSATTKIKLTNVDSWFESELNSIIKDTTELMELTLFRSALQRGYFELQHTIRWYIKRSSNTPNNTLLNKAIETQLLILAPFAPFICEEIWQNLGKNPAKENTENAASGKKFISLAKWPAYNEKKIKPELNAVESWIRNTEYDLNEVIKLSKVEKPALIQLFVAHSWKYSLFTELKKLTLETKNPGEILKKVMQLDQFRKYGQEISRFLPRLVGSGKIPNEVLSQKLECSSLQDAQQFFEKVFNCRFEVIKAEDTKEQKAMQATPGKAAIVVK